MRRLVGFKERSKIRRLSSAIGVRCILAALVGALYSVPAPSMAQQGPVGLSVTLVPVTPVQEVGLPFLFDLTVTNNTGEGLDLQSGQHFLYPISFSIAYVPDERAMMLCGGPADTVASDLRVVALSKTLNPSAPRPAETEGMVSAERIESMCAAIASFHDGNFVAFDPIDRRDVRSRQTVELEAGNSRHGRFLADRDYLRGDYVFDLPGTYSVRADYRSWIGAEGTGVTSIRVIDPSAVEQAGEYLDALEATTSRRGGPEEDVAQRFRRVVDADPNSNYGKFARYYFGVYILRQVPVRGMSAAEANLLVGTGVLDVCAAPDRLFPSPELAMPCRIHAAATRVALGDFSGARELANLVTAAEPKGYEVSPGIATSELRHYLNLLLTVADPGR